MEKMLNLSDVTEIVNSIMARHEIDLADEDLINEVEDIDSIIYCVDSFSDEEEPIITREIDIEFTFGEYYEIHEEDELFYHICSLCDLKPYEEETKEIVLYKK